MGPTAQPQRQKEAPSPQPNKNAIVLVGSRDGAHGGDGGGASVLLSRLLRCRQWLRESQIVQARLVRSGRGGAVAGGGAGFVTGAPYPRRLPHPSPGLSSCLLQFFLLLCSGYSSVNLTPLSSFEFLATQALCVAAAHRF